MFVHASSFPYDEYFMDEYFPRGRVWVTVTVTGSGTVTVSIRTLWTNSSLVVGASGHR